MTSNYLPSHFKKKKMQKRSKESLKNHHMKKHPTKFKIILWRWIIEIIYLNKYLLFKLAIYFLIFRKFNQIYLVFCPFNTVISAWINKFPGTFKLKITIAVSFKRKYNPNLMQLVKQNFKYYFTFV